jgi:hypothetical protein
MDIDLTSLGFISYESPFFYPPLIRPSTTPLYTPLKMLYLPVIVYVGDR